MITLTNISKTFDQGHTFVVQDVNLDIIEGETLVLLGASGCGKTTLLRMINRLIEPTSGTITLEGVNTQEMDLVTLRRTIGYAFQGVGLFPHMTVAENIAIVLKLEGQSQSKQRERAQALLDMVNLDPVIYSDRFPHELSGGQQQRVGVARALASNPQYILMDEPFGALDAINREAMQSELIALRDRLQKTIVFVTHDIFEAMRLGDRIAVMNQGRVEQIGTAEQLLNHPQTDYVASLFQTTQDQVQQFNEHVYE